MNYIEISVEDFIQKYKPMVNALSQGAGFDFGEGGVMFETYGEEYDRVTAMSKENFRKVWTIKDDFDGLRIESGKWHVDRLGYILTQEPWPDETSIMINLE